MSPAIKSVVELDQVADSCAMATTPLALNHAQISGAETGLGSEKIFVVDDDYYSRDGICGLLRDSGWEVEAFSSCEAFLATYRYCSNTCLILDIHFPEMGGLELLGRLSDLANTLPVIAVSGSSGISEAVQSMRQGALDFIEKPVARDKLVASVTRALAHSRRTDTIAALRAAALGHLAGLTVRQNQVLDRVLDGQPSKNIAADLGISQRTVENHRASIMQRTGARSLPALAQLVMYSHAVTEKPADTVGSR